MLALVIYGTVYFVLTEHYTIFVPLLVLLWFNFALLLFTHRGNIKRFFRGEENKIEFKKYLCKKKKSPENQNVELATSAETAQEEVNEDDNGKTM